MTKTLTPQEVDALKEFADVRNEAEDADIQLACIADQLGIKGSIKDWLQSIGGAIRDLKAEVERLTKALQAIDKRVFDCLFDDMELTSHRQSPKSTLTPSAP